MTSNPWILVTSTNVSTIPNVSPERLTALMNADVHRHTKENSANSKIKWSDLKEIKELMRNAGIKTATVTRRAENVPKNAKNKNIGIISSKSTVVARNGLTKWPNVSDPTIQMLTLAFQQKSKREKSNLSVRMALPQEKKLKLCGNVVGKSRKYGAKLWFYKVDQKLIIRILFLHELLLSFLRNHLLSTVGNNFFSRGKNSVKSRFRAKIFRCRM
jgi:hypothetical protein